MICNDCKKECDNFPKVTECKTCGNACKACADECQMKKLISVRQALEDPAWLGSMLGGESFAVMRTLLIAAMSEALTAAEMHIFTQLILAPWKSFGLSRGGVQARRAP